MTEAAAKLCQELVASKGSPPIIGGVVLHRVIGSGGMGVVYQGTHLRLRIPVAVKFLVLERDESFSISRFIDEASLAAKITSPNVVRVFDVNREGAFEYIVQEYVNGETADQRLRDASLRQQKLSEDFVLELAADTARGLSAIHDSEHLHLDIKPANIIVSQRNGVCKILDFGLARPYDKTAMVGTMPMNARECVDGGTPGYSSPEQLQMLRVGPQSDVYSLGVTMFELLTGRRAYTVETWEEAQRIQSTEQVPDPRIWRPEISQAAVSLIARCVNPNPHKRFDSALEMLSEISKVKQQRMTATLPPATSTYANQRTENISAFKKNAPFVVCVDDNAQICMLMAELLQNAGYRAETFTEGARALARINEEIPDVVFLDMEMPGMNGVEICRAIRANSALKNIPVVFVTGETSPDTMRRAMSEGATDYLLKPIQTEELISRVQCLSRISRANQELAQLQKQFTQFRTRLSTLSGKELA